jgi:hypothetical protein
VPHEPEDLLTLRKRGLEHVDYVLAISTGHPEATAARGYRQLAFRLPSAFGLPADGS